MQVNPNEVVKRGIIANIKNPDKQVQMNGIDLTISESVTLLPKSFVNVSVNEKFNMIDVFGIINIRSSFSRKGIFSTSGIYDDGFNGIGGVSLYNLSDTEIKIDKDTRIAQMIVFKSDAGKKYEGIYNTKKTITSKYGE